MSVITTIKIKNKYYFYRILIFFLLPFFSFVILAVLNIVYKHDILHYTCTN